MSKPDKGFEETNDTLPESTGRQYAVEGYTNESIAVPQTKYQEYYTYPNAGVHEYENKKNSSMNISCSGNSFSCKPQNRKVFIRRVDNKRKTSNKKYNSFNNSFCQEYNPYVIYPSNSIQGSNMEDYNYSMPMSDKNAEYKEKYISNSPNRLTYAYLSDDINYSLNGQFMDLNNMHTNVPICIRESFQSKRVNDLMNRMYPMSQDEYNLNNTLPNVVDLKCDVIAKDILRYIRMFIRYIYKVVKLAFAKIKRDLNTKEIYFDPTIPPIHQMDMECEVCRKKYGDILLDAHQKDCISFFEGVDESRTIFSKLWDIINNWLDSKESDKIDVLRSQRSVEQLMQENRKEYEEVYYQMENFPRDENGKIELPQFNDISRQSIVMT
ncbi:inner membrane complex protein, putative [Plasmodium malariae]|uniref:Inner membrane complex protein, putative n=1 Tax=Plasmodium malariae TaxID=5858 RepID=A0A1C3L099_PLAMA|nr:inner membrane complex protein, putative [Plasmodium malariae]